MRVPLQFLSVVVSALIWLSSGIAMRPLCMTTDLGLSRLISSSPGSPSTFPKFEIRRSTDRDLDGWLVLSKLTPATSSAGGASPYLGLPATDFAAHCPHSADRPPCLSEHHPEPAPVPLLEKIPKLLNPDAPAYVPSGFGGCPHGYNLCVSRTEGHCGNDELVDAWGVPYCNGNGGETGVGPFCHSCGKADKKQRKMRAQRFGGLLSYKQQQQQRLLAQPVTAGALSVDTFL